MPTKTSTESVPGVASWVNIPVPSFGNIQVPSFGHDIFSLPPIQNYRKPIYLSKVPPIQNRGTEIMSPQSNYGYRENVSSSVGLTFGSLVW